MPNYNVELSIPTECNTRYKDLAYMEEYRVIGGDKGDIHFYGYDIGGFKTFLYLPVLHTRLGLTSDEAQDIAQDILIQAYNSIGSEVLE